ncbi:MAG: tripartite tricarboxylate transporter substrate binding protein [Betaproteobacteria bacterium]|nr:tripartite tricarboxylate transporter substrate binding protein [Betaproteobacteria bacterium]
MKNHGLHSLALALALFSAGAPATGADSAKDYPDRPVRLIVPNAPGSAVDTLSRIVGTKLSEVIGQQIVMDNRPGASGIIAMEIGKNGTPDGYTLITATTAASTVARLLQKKPTFHPVTDYDYVVQFAETPNVLVVNPPLPIKSVKELIAYAKSKQTGFNMASAGAGSQSHLSGAFFQQAAKIESLHVPYKGGGPSVASVVAGESQWTLIPSPAAMLHVNAGRLRAIAHTLPGPTPLLPNIPPIADTLPGFDYSGWMGFFVPKGTPKPIVDKLRAAVVKTMATPEVKKGMAFQATEIVIGGPAEFRKVVQDSMVKNAKLVKALGLSATN